MNVCLVHEEYPLETNFGGIATYQKTLAEELVMQGNNVFVICRGLSENKQYIENGVNVIRIFVEKTNNQINDYIKYRKRVSNELKKLQNNNLIDIIETPDWGAETVLFEKYRKIPLIVRLHTPLKIWLKYNKNNFGKVTNKMLYWENKMLLSCDYITCCSEILKSIIITEFDLNKEILVTPNPANIKNFYCDKMIKKSNKLLFAGSLEERKGVIILAKSLNIVFNKYPTLTIDFIGKDTIRNSQNISTKELIQSIVEKRYFNNLNFVGQISNEDLNYYFNSALVGIFPSLFDNFPYVVLESMATGLHVIGSKNSGMVEILNDNSSIYNTGDFIDLANKIIDKYELSMKQKYNLNNIKRVQEIYNASKICLETINLYLTIIKTYNMKKTSKDELNFVIQNELNASIHAYKKEKNGVANMVYKVDTLNKKYIIKKYIYNYDFNLARKLYKIYEDNNINVIKPVNEDIIYYKDICYNIFEYKKKYKLKNVDYNFLKKIVCCKNRDILEYNLDSLLVNKCLKYYDYLKQNSCGKVLQEEIDYVLNEYDEIKNLNILNEKYINHGDISIHNIISYQNNLYLIDFDEVNIAPLLYDFAVIVIKMFSKNGNIKLKEYNKFREIISNELKIYSNNDYKNIIKFYLCKILLEKFYYHQNGKINLFSKRQMKDNYKQYLKILNYIDLL